MWYKFYRMSELWYDNTFVENTMNSSNVDSRNTYFSSNKIFIRSSFRYNFEHAGIGRNIYPFDNLKIIRIIQPEPITFYCPPYSGFTLNFPG